MVREGAQSDPRLTSFSLSMEELGNNPEIVRDLEFVFGDWEQIARGNIV